MLALIAALLVSSLVILCFEEYIEDNELSASRQLMQGGKLSYPVTGDATVSSFAFQQFNIII
jgi:hypothetical protein